MAQTKESLTVRVRKVNGITVIDLKGRLIMGEAIEAATAQVNELLSSGNKNLAFNLADVSYVDSSGIGWLIGVNRRTREAGGTCKFFAAHKRVIQLLRIARIDTRLVILADESSALSSF